jgi:hypothetical protein
MKAREDAETLTVTPENRETLSKTIANKAELSL